MRDSQEERSRPSGGRGHCRMLQVTEVDNKERRGNRQQDVHKDQPLGKSQEAFARAANASTRIPQLSRIKLGAPT